jgi:hypothetical protein
MGMLGAHAAWHKEKWAAMRVYVDAVDPPGVGVQRVSGVHHVNSACSLPGMVPTTACVTVEAAIVIVVLKRQICVVQRNGTPTTALSSHSSHPRSSSACNRVLMSHH